MVKLYLDFGGVNMKKILSVIMVLIMSVSLMTISVSAASSPKLSKSSTNLSIGYVTTLKVTGNKGNVQWSSKDSSIAAVKSSDGNTAKISGKKSGTTYIYAKTDGKTLKCKVTVKKSFITTSKNSLDINKGSSKAITITVQGSKDITVTRSDKSVCTVSWGKWDGNKIKLTVKGAGSGTCDLKIYTKGYSSSTAKTVTVNVTDPDDPASSSSMTDQVVELVNKEREKAGLSALTADDTLNEVAALRAEELIKKFDHTRPDGTPCFTAFDEAGAKYFTAGENIAWGQKSADSVMESWMNSSGHKANILGKNFTKIGVGCVKYNGSYYWVQVFTG